MKLRRWYLGLIAFVLLIVAVCSAYVRIGTTVIGDYTSPDEAYDAVLLVRNGGAMTGYATAISIVRNNPLSRQLALISRPNLFVVDDNDGAVRWGDRGQLEVKLSWISDTQLLVQYPAKARVLKQNAAYQSTVVRYVIVN